MINATPFDRQAAGSKAGVLLEAILDHLALQYRCALPLTHDGQHDLRELLSGTRRLLRRIEVQRPDLDAQNRPLNPPSHSMTKVDAVVTQIEGLAFVRNQVGAHFNLGGSAVPDAELQQFANLAVQLVRGLSCATCGQVPGTVAGTHFRCRCAVPKETRLLPLQV